MKTIILRESQFNKLLNEVSPPTFDNGDMIENPGNSGQVFTTSPVQNEDGELRNGKNPTSDDFADTQTPQNWYRANATKAYHS